MIGSQYTRLAIDGECIGTSQYSSSAGRLPEKSYGRHGSPAEELILTKTSPLMPS
jgi:hypothetical protein